MGFRPLGRTVFTIVIALLTMVLFSNPAQATLIKITYGSSFVVFDDVNNIQWADPTMFETHDT
jgi:hypothetical protein